MNMSLLGVLLVCALGVCTSVSAVLAYASVSRDARCRRRRSRFKLVVGARAAAGRGTRRTGARSVAEPQPDTVSWDPLPVTQWQPPREHESEPSPAA
jgi:hypothetical protein